MQLNCVFCFDIKIFISNVYDLIATWYLTKEVSKDEDGSMRENVKPWFVGCKEISVHRGLPKDIVMDADFARPKKCSGDFCHVDSSLLKELMEDGEVPRQLVLFARQRRPFTGSFFKF